MSISENKKTFLSDLVTAEDMEAFLVFLGQRDQISEVYARKLLHARVSLNPILVEGLTEIYRKFKEQEAQQESDALSDTVST